MKYNQNYYKSFSKNSDFEINHQEILARDSLEKSTTKGKLIDRIYFLASTPFNLIIMGNLIEEEIEVEISNKNLIEENLPITIFNTKNIGTTNKNITLEIFSSENNWDKLNEDLLSALTGEDSYLKISAIRILKNSSAKEQYFNYLITLLNDKNEFVRLESVSALRNFKNKKEVFKNLIIASKDSSNLIRAEALKILSNISAKRSYNIIKKALNDEDAYVREVAKSIIEKITKK